MLDHLSLLARGTEHISSSDPTPIATDG